MITGVKLKNWKSHLDSEFSFQPGVNALVGIVGSGKTSILQAISFGLFGTTNSVKTRKITLDKLIMDKPQPKKTAEVRIKFSVDGINYSVRRVLKKGSGTAKAEIRKEGSLLEVNPKSVTAEIERILQMDYELFSRAVYSEQNDMDYFLRIPKGKRTDHIDRMLKVDRFEKVREQSVGLKNNILARREERLKLVEEMKKEGLGKKRKSLEKNITEMRKEMERETEKAKSASDKKKALESRMEKMEKTEKRVSKLKTEIQGLRSGLEELEKNIESKKQDLGELEPGKMMEKIKNEIEEKRKFLEETRNRQEEMTRKMVSYNTRIKLISDSMKKLEKIDAKCPVCESEVNKEKKTSLLNRKRSEESELRKKAKSVAASLSDIKEKGETLEKLLQKKELEKKELEMRIKEMQKLEDDEKRVKEYNSKINSLREEKSKMESSFSEERLAELRKEVRKFAEVSSAAMERLSGLEKHIKGKEEHLEQIRSREKRLKEYRESLEQSRKVAESLNVFTRVLSSTQEQLRKQFVKTVNHIVQNVWDSLYPYGDFNSIRLAADDDYTLQLRSGQDWIPVEGTASGGERSMACLALRIAFSYAFIPNLKWLILDEPTHNLDTDSIRNLSNILQEKIGNFAEQVFLITHEEKISKGLDSVYILDRDKGKNEPTRIVEN